MDSNVICPTCGEPIIDVRREGHGRPTGWMCPHPTTPNAVLAYCATCAKVMTIRNVRLVAFSTRRNP